MLGNFVCRCREAILRLAESAQRVFMGQKKRKVSINIAATSTTSSKQIYI